MTDKEKQYLIDGLLEYMDDYRYQIDAKEKAYALADKRLVMLKRCEENMERCPVCLQLLIPVGEHDGFCELAEAIAEE